MTAVPARRRLADLLEIQNGYAFDSKSFSPATGIPLIRIRDLKGGSSTETRYSGYFDPVYLVHAGDLLVGMDGEFVCYEWQGEPALLNQRVCRLQGFSSDLLPRYLFYGINRHLKDIEDVTGFATVKHLSSKSILNIEMLLPRRHEQERIVATLDEAFAAIATARANTERALANASAVFQGQVDRVFEVAGPDWAETTLQRVLAIQPRNGWSPPAEHHSGTGTPVLTLSAVTGFRFRGDKVKFTSAYADPKRPYWVKNGDLLISRSNTPGLVGHVAIATGLTAPTIYPDLIMRMVPDPSRALTEFLYYHLRSRTSRLAITGRAQGTNPTMVKISNGAVQGLPVRLPPLPEQEKIVSQLDALSDQTHRLGAIYERKLRDLAALRQSLLHQAFSGAL